MKKIEALIWGIKHIGGSHDAGGHAYTDHSTGEVHLYTLDSVPTTADVNFLAEDMGVRDRCKVEGYSVEITLPKEWVDTIGQQEFVPTTGMMMWKRTAIPLGAHLGYMAEEYDPFYGRSGKFYRHYDTFEQAKEACDTECKRTHNGNLYSVWEITMDKNEELYCCQWSSKGELVELNVNEL